MNEISKVDSSPRKCPACSKVGTFTNDAERGETFCNSCGTVLQEGESVHSVESKTVPSMQNLGLGELAPKRSEYAAITDHPTGRTESNIIASQFKDGEKELNAIRTMAESAARWLDLPRNAEMLLTENTVRRGSKLLSLVHAGEKRVSLEKLTAYALLSEAKKLGKSIGEVQSALARSIFKIHLLLVTVSIATHIPDGAKFFLTSDSATTARQPLQFKMSKMKNEDSRTVELIHAYDLKDYAAYTVKLNIELCDVLAVKPDLDSSQVSKLFLISENALIRDGPKLVPTTRLQVNPSKCFALFKRAELLAGEDVTANPDFRADESHSSSSSRSMPRTAGGLDVEKFARSRLPSKFPISSMLMKEAGCLQKMEVEYMNSVKRLVSSHENYGRTPSRLLLEALRSADRSVFESLSPEIACRLGVKAAKLGLISGKKKSISSFLVAGEVR